MTSQIPACKNCKHFQASPDEMFSTCDRYHHETVDYLNGTVNRHNSLAFAMRDKEKFCGREGKNFEMKEFVEEEETFSIKTGIAKVTNKEVEETTFLRAVFKSLAVIW